MSATHPIEPNSALGVEQRPYEPSMEEILASIRRIIADDQSLPGRGALPEPAAAEALPEPAPAPVLRGPIDIGAGHKPETAPEPVPFARPVAVVAPRPPMEDHFERRQDHHPVAREARAVEAETEIHAPPPGMAPLGTHMAHGPMAAPQFAMPDSVPATPEPLAPHQDEIPEGIDLHAAESQQHPEFLDEPEPSIGHHEALEEPLDDGYDEPLGRAPVYLGDRQHRQPDALISAATDSSVTAAFKTLAAARLADNSDELLDIAREMIRPLLKSWIDNNLPSMVERMVRAEIERVARGGR